MTSADSHSDTPGPDNSAPVPSAGALEALQRVLGELARENDELRRARDEAEAARTRNSTMLDLTSPGILAVDKSGLILDANRTAAEILGAERSALAGQPAEHFVTPESREQFHSLWEKAANGTAPHTGEVCLRKRDGRPLPCHVKAASAQDGDGAVIVCLELSPVDSLDRLERELLEKEERLALATLCNGIGIWDWNLTTGELVWDESMFALYHIRREDFSGTEHAWRTALHPEDTGTAVRELEEALAGPKPFATEFRVVWPSGEVRHIKAIAKVFRDENGRPLRMLGTNWDVTERKNAQATLTALQASLSAANDNLRRTNEDLERRVTMRTAQLRTLAIELTQAEERERLRIAETLHEGLLQQLAAASIHLSNFQRQIDKGVPPGGIDDLRACLNEGIHIGRTLTHEIFPPALQTLGLSDALHWLANWYSEKYGLHVHVETGSDADIEEMEFRIALFRAAKELLYNTHKHSGVRQASVRLRRAPGGVLRLVVSDSGAGFDPESARAREGQRGGFGLFSLRERVEALGGLFHVRSAPGHGCRVTILFATQKPDIAPAVGSQKNSPAARLSPLDTSRERAGSSVPESAGEPPRTSEAEMDHLIHRLHVNQIELEMRNEELLRAQEELDLSRARYRDLYELAPVGYLTVDADDRVLDVNVTGASMLGSTKDRIRGTVFASRIAPADHAQFRLLQHRVRTTGVGESSEFRMLRLDGEEFWALLSIVSAKDDSDRSVLRLTLSDITARKVADEERRELGRKLRLHYEQTPVGVVEWDLEYRVTLWNPAAEAIFGYSAFEAIGRDSAFIVPDGVRPVVDEVWRNLVVTKTGRCSTNDNLRSDGKIITCEWYNTPLMDDDGTLKGIASFVVDVTARRLAEIERETIERKMQETQRLESLGVLAGGIAHDFNNLLTGILGNANLATMEASATPSIRGYLDHIATESRRAADLCHELLAYSGRAHFAVQRLDLCKLVEETARMLKVSVSKKAALHFRLSKDLPLVDADATQIRQILINLAINASEALGENSGEITISTGRLHANRACLDASPASSGLPEGEYVFLEVSDTGCGMSAETLDRVFDPFFTTKFTGRGLGLASAAGIVRSHKGALLVESTPGVGSKFRMLLPAENAPSQATTTADTGPTAKSWEAGSTILVADDEESVRRIVSRMLPLMGLDPVLTSDGREAVEVFKADPSRFTLVLLDLSMPNLGGEEAFELIRKIRHDIPVVLMSGYDMSRTVLRLPSKGVSSFLPKPFSMQELRTALESAIA